MENSHKFWNLVRTAPGKATMDIYGTIAQEESWWSDNVSARAFNQELDELEDVDEINVRINSPGGDPIAATAIYNRLKAHRANIIVDIEGMAASAATIIAMAGDDIKIAKNGIFMIHNPVVVVGYGRFEVEDLTKLQNELSTIEKNITTTYADRTGLTTEAVKKLMDAETWWTGAEAVEEKFCDRLLFEEAQNTIQNNGVYFVNSIAMNDKTCSKMPEKIKRIFNKLPEPQPQPAAETRDETMTIENCEQLRAEYPELVNQIENNARSAERERIKEIEDMAIPGFENLVTEAKYKNVQNTAADIAKAIVKAQREENDTQLQNRENDIAESNVNHVPAAGVNRDELFANEAEKEFQAMVAGLDKVAAERYGR